MTSDPTYSPSPELVEAVVNDGQWMRWEPEVRLIIHAAVAYRTESGDPELVPWAQVQALVAAVAGWVDVMENPVWNCWPDNPCYYECADAWKQDTGEAASRLRAALAPWKDNAKMALYVAERVIDGGSARFTQEPEA